MGLFGKKKDNADNSQDPPGEDNSRNESEQVPIAKLIADVEKLKAQFSTFYELNKANTERFTRINEQIGELRTMILDRDKASRVLEAKATQAIGMVESVQPDKFMVELRKLESKTEALKANLESNEMMVKNALSELKEIRNKIFTFRGMEEMVKLNEEVKGELMEIKKLSATVGRHSDKVETIFSELQKKIGDVEKMSDKVEGLDKSLRQIASELDNFKVRISEFATKKDIEDLLSKFKAFEKYVSGIVGLIHKKMNNFEKDLLNDVEEKTKKVEKLLSGFEELAKKTPELDKFFHLLEDEAKKAPQKEVKVEKIKVPGEEEPIEKPEEKPSLAERFKGLKEKISKIGSKEE